MKVNIYIYNQLENIDEKCNSILQKKRELKNKIKHHLESIRIEYIILFSIIILFIKKFCL